MLKKHARYAKYYYTETIWILRCICTVCGVTHAVIPEFSLPGTTIGTEEAETYIKRREQGLGRQRASQVFSGEKAMSVNHPAALDRAFRVAVDRSKAIFSEKADIRLSGCAWIEALTGSKERPMVTGPSSRTDPQYSATFPTTRRFAGTQRLSSSTGTARFSGISTARGSSSIQRTGTRYLARSASCFPATMSGAP